MADDSKSVPRNPWTWIPTLYFAQGLPFAAVNFVSVVLYKSLGVSNTDIAFYTAWLYLPWVLKPLWSPVVDLWRTRRGWIWVTQLLMGAAFAAVALTLPLSWFFQATLAVFYLAAFASATHDIAADGFYLMALSERQQAFFVGVRSAFFRVSLITGQGLLVMLSGVIQTRTGSGVVGWMSAFGVLATLLTMAGAYHRFVLPRPSEDRMGDVRDLPAFLSGFVRTFAAFFRKDDIGRFLIFLLLYRFAEAQLVKLAAPFLLDTRAAGGLGLTTAQVGFVYGTVGTIALILGGLLGGFAASRNGLRAWLWPMALAIQLPNAVYVYLAAAQPSAFWIVNVCVAVEQFGYGFGFAAYLLVMMYVARGAHQTAHYAICTGFMALGMMLPGMFSGWIQEHIGYPNFFTWVLLATIPGFMAVRMVRIDPEFGRRRN